MMAIRTRFLGPTNYRSARIKASTTDSDPRQRRSATIPYPHELGIRDAHAEAVRALHAKMEWPCYEYVGACVEEGMVWVPIMPGSMPVHLG